MTVMNGANRWEGDSKVTAPSFDFSATASQSLSVSPLFERYYHSHSGPTSLGVPESRRFPYQRGVGFSSLHGERCSCQQFSRYIPVKQTAL